VPVAPVVMTRSLTSETLVNCPSERRLTLYLPSTTEPIGWFTFSRVRAVWTCWMETP
jgi:hypothetical protein